MYGLVLFFFFILLPLLCVRFFSLHFILLLIFYFEQFSSSLPTSTRNNVMCTAHTTYTHFLSRVHQMRFVWFSIRLASITSYLLFLYGIFFLFAIARFVDWRQHAYVHYTLQLYIRVYLQHWRSSLFCVLDGVVFRLHFSLLLQQEYTVRTIFDFVLLHRWRRCLPLTTDGIYTIQYSWSFGFDSIHVKCNWYRRHRTYIWF